jgi:glycosyltransferase involved in cell wall biosynthesis
MKQRGPLHVAFAPWMVAGVRTQWENMRPHLSQRTDVCLHVAEIYPYKPDGLVEKLPLPSEVKGNVRSMMHAGRLFSLPQLDAVCMNIRTGLPYILTKGLLKRTVVVSATDATMVQLASFGALYDKTPNESLRGRLRTAVDTFCAHRATLHAPWSEWAARSLRDDYGVPAHRIRVVPPGLNLEQWPLQDRRPRAPGDVARLLFVGGDFVRKGGDLLLDVFSQHLQDRCELHLVTRDDVPERPGVHVYRNFGPNDPGLRDLYAYCDIFVLPTRADCFSLASMEAMATGLPVVTSEVGGIPEIVADGHSGFLIARDDGRALFRCLDTLIGAPDVCAAMGAEGRRIVEDRFDAARNTARLLDHIVDLCRRRDCAGAHPSPDRG